MGILQRKVIDSRVDLKTKNTFPDDPPPRKYFKSYGMCDRTRVSESANISFSRNSDSKPPHSH